MGLPVETLARMGYGKVFVIFTDRRGKERLVQRLDGPARNAYSMTFIPVECFETGQRFEPALNCLRLLTEMEVLAWASKT